MKIQKTNAKMSQDGKFLVVTLNGETGFVNSNLLRYFLGVPYTKKNGIHVSSEDISFTKRKAQIAYVQKIQANKTQESA